MSMQKDFPLRGRWQRKLTDEGEKNNGWFRNLHLTTAYGGASPQGEAFVKLHLNLMPRGMPIRVFGSGNGEVTVRFLGETVTGKSENGKWCVFLSSGEAGGPYEMEVNLNNEKTVLHDVLIGDVFLACGQSNMEMPLFRTAYL